MKHVNHSSAYTTAAITREYVENFYNLVTLDAWTSIVVDTGSTLTKAVGGGAVLTTDGTANDEVGLWTTDLIVPGTTNSVSFELQGRMKFSVVTALDAFIGLSSAFGADAIADTAAVPAAGYYNGFFMIAGVGLYYISVHNGATAANQLLEFAPAAATFFSYKLTYEYNSAEATMTCTPQIDPLGGQNFKPVRASGSASPIHPAFYQSPNVYGAFPAAGLKYGTYIKAGGTAAVVTWDYAAWAIRRTN